MKTNYKFLNYSFNKQKCLTIITPIIKYSLIGLSATIVFEYFEFYLYT